MSDAYLQINNLKTHFPVEKGILFRKVTGTVKAVDDVSLSLAKGEVLGLVGESGCGKSTLGRTVLQLIKPTAGTVTLGDRTLTDLDGKELRSARADFQMIFQDPYASLNPRMTVYSALAEAIQVHRKVPKAGLAKAVGALMEKVGLAARFMRKYPHEFSGGQRQRIAIARALAVEPKLIIADEPVSALDVSIQAQILNLLSDLTREMELTMIFISHDLSVVKHISDRIAVMYLGRIVEIGPATEVFNHPQHPYTKALVSAVPMPDPDSERTRKRILLPGDPPSPLNPPFGCTFHPRCSVAIEECTVSFPDFSSLKNNNHKAACIRLANIHADTDDPNKAANELRQSKPTPKLNLENHRGSQILRLGIASTVVATGAFAKVFAQGTINITNLSLFLIIFFGGIPAWKMGKRDLEKMKAGRMNPEGESNTKAGMICGIIGCIVSTIAAVVWMLKEIL
jgi:oligopeptide transport system ATP-binding protein